MSTLTQFVVGDDWAANTFTSTGTWVHPNPGTPVFGRAILIGGGGGGGSGSLGIGTDRGPTQGGGGGGAGEVVVAPFVATANLTVTIGAGGSGGAGQSSTSTSNVYLDGNNGSNGGTTIFGTIRAAGGGGGLGGKRERANSWENFSGLNYYLLHNGGYGYGESGNYELHGGHGGREFDVPSVAAGDIYMAPLIRLSGDRSYSALGKEDFFLNDYFGSRGMWQWGYNAGTISAFTSGSGQTFTAGGGGGAAGPLGAGGNAGARAYSTSNSTTPVAGGAGVSAAANSGAGGGGGGGARRTVTQLSGRTTSSGTGGNGGSGYAIIYTRKL